MCTYQHRNVRIRTVMSSLRVLKSAKMGFCRQGTSVTEILSRPLTLLCASLGRRRSTNLRRIAAASNLLLSTPSGLARAFAASSTSTQFNSFIKLTSHARTAAATEPVELPYSSSMPSSNQGTFSLKHWATANRCGPSNPQPANEIFMPKSRLSNRSESDWLDCQWRLQAISSSAAIITCCATPLPIKTRMLNMTAADLVAGLLSA